MKATVTHIAQTFPTELPALVTNRHGDIVLAIPTPYARPDMPAPLLSSGLFCFVSLNGGDVGRIGSADKADFIPFNGSITLSN